MKIIIYGASDDLIEIAGDIRDEFGGPGCVELSTGDVFEVTYDEDETGVWNVKHVCDSGKCKVDIEFKKEEDDDGYSGRAVVEGPILWVKGWYDWPVTDASRQDWLLENLEDLEGESLVQACQAVLTKQYDVSRKR